MTEGFHNRRHHRTDSQNLSYFNVDEDGKIVDQGMGRTLNISQSGILLETNSNLHKGQLLDMEVAMHDQLIKANGKVVHCQDIGNGQYQAGIEFTVISPEDQAVLKQFI